MRPAGLLRVHESSKKMIGSRRYSDGRSLAGSTRETHTMRLIAVVLATFASAPTSAWTWQEYSYPAESFGVAFPAAPTIETVSYQTADGRAVEARLYSVTEE